MSETAATVSSTIEITVNGEPYRLEVKHKETLLEVLRHRLELTGTKEGCGSGDCGACTVIIEGASVNACLVLAVEVNGNSIVTIEGLSSAGELHPIQQAFIDAGAVQCGFCTPGMIMSTKALLDKNGEPGEEEIRRAFSGNLCRCTGYVKIVNAIKEATRKLKEGD